MPSFRINGKVSGFIKGGIIGGLSFLIPSYFVGITTWTTLSNSGICSSFRILSGQTAGTCETTVYNLMSSNGIFIPVLFIAIILGALVNQYVLKL